MEHNRRVLRFASATAALLVLFFLTLPVHAAGEGVFVGSKDKLTGEISSAEDTDQFTVELGTGGRLDVSVKVAKGSALLPTIRLFRPDGTEAGIGGLIKKPGTGKPALKKFIAPATGLWRIVIGSGDGATGEYTIVVKIINAKKGGLKGLVAPAGGTNTLEFAAGDGTTGTAKLKLAGGTLPTGVRVIDPDGEEVPGSATDFTDKGKATVSFTVKGDFGVYQIEVTADEAGSANVDVKLKLKHAKTVTRTETLGPESVVTAVAPKEIRQEDVKATLTVTGENFVAGTKARVSGEGVTVGKVTVVNATTLTVEVDVSAETAYGLRELTIIPPALIGEPAKFAEAVTVFAPVPEVTAIDSGPTKQGDGAATVVVRGMRFREGGRVTFSGGGLFVASTTVDSDTQATVVLNVADDAPIGQRAVTFTQPAAGGAADHTKPSLLRINYPDPVVTEIGKSSVKQGETESFSVTGQGYRPGATVSFSGTGLTVTESEFVSESEITVTVQVAQLAEYGLRDVSVTQTADGGGATDTADDLLTVLAPDPTITSTVNSTIVQGTTDNLVTVKGTNFRLGGALTVTGEGLTLSNVNYVSATEFRGRLDAAIDAELGTHTIKYSQPEEGGGASFISDAAPTVNAPTPTVTGISPSTVKQLETATVLTVTGTNFRDGGGISADGTGLTFGTVTVTSTTTAMVAVTVDEEAAVGTRELTFTQPAIGGGDTGTGTDLLTVHHPDPAISLVQPSQIRRGKSGTLTLFGNNFRDGGLVTSDLTGVTLSAQTHLNNSAFRVNYVAAVDAPLTSGDLTYTHPANGGGAAVTKTDGLEVFSLPPVFTSITPDEWRPGDAGMTATIIGSRFEDGMNTAFSAGMTVAKTTFVSATEITIVLSVESSADLEKVDLILLLPTGPLETFDDKVEVVPGDVTVTAFSHESLTKGASSVGIEITGTGFRPGATLSGGGGVTFSDIDVVDAETITAKVSVTTGAGTGERDLTITHPASEGGRSGRLDDAFEVVATTVTVTASNPAALARTGTGGKDRTVTATITGTGFMSGAAVSVAKTSGSGLTVVTGSEKVLSSKEMTVEITVGATTTTGTWSVKVTNPGSLGNSGTTGDGKIDVKTKSTLTVNQVVPCAGATYGGERVTLHGGGFKTGAVVDFGAVRGYGTIVIDENTLVTTVPQPDSASKDAATLVAAKVTNPSSSSATRGDGYAYAKDVNTCYMKRQYPVDLSTGNVVTLRSSVILFSTPVKPDTVPFVVPGVYDHTNSTYWWGDKAFTGGFRSFGPDARWMVLARTSTTDLEIASKGVYRMRIPRSTTAISGVPVSFVLLRTWDSESTAMLLEAGKKDTTAPTLNAVTPAAGATGVAITTKVVFTFDEWIDPIKVDTSIFSLEKGGVPVGCRLMLADDLKSVTLIPHTTLDTDTTYTVKVTAAVRDFSWNTLTASTTTFKTGDGTDNTAPTLVVTIEDLPKTVDGSTQYISGNETSGPHSNLTALSAGSKKDFDLYLPRSGFLLACAFDDEGGAGIDADSFSAKCSVAVGSTSANSELASKFDVSHTSARWRIPDAEKVTAAENVVFTFVIQDTKGNKTTKTVTVDVADISSNSANTTNGGDLDPLNKRQTWILRGDLDTYTVTYVDLTVTHPELGFTTTNTSNGKNDFDETLEFTGLESSKMTDDAKKAVNGISRGTNEIMRRLMLERIRELVRERFGMDADGTRDEETPNLEFLLAGEQGSLSALPRYSSAKSANSSKAFSEISIGVTAGPAVKANQPPPIYSAGVYDVRNRNQEALINDDGTYGVFLMALMHRPLNDNWQSDLPWLKKISKVFVTVHGGTPVGEHASDDDVLSENFNRATSGNTTHNQRYDDIFDALEIVAKYASTEVAHTIAHAMGLLPDGPPKTGLFGHAHRDNDFTDASTATYPIGGSYIGFTRYYLNISQHMFFADMNNLMAPEYTEFEVMRDGSDFRKLNPLLQGHMRRRILYDEGK